jgi:hypothetical protein
VTEPENVPTIIESLANVMADVTSIAKKDFNKFHEFNFRGIDTVLEHIGPALRDHRIVPVPELRDVHSDDLTAKDGKRKRGVTLTVAYTFYGPRGDSITTVVPGEANDTEDKATSKAMSVAYRTALLQVFAIPSGERDPHAGPTVSAKLARLREEIKKLGAERGWNFDALRDEYATWCQGQHDITEATEDDLEKFAVTLRPKKQMQRGSAGGEK